MAPLENEIRVTVNFFSFFKELAGCASSSQTVPRNSTLSTLLGAIAVRFPKLEPLQKSMLIAVGVEYQDRSYILRDGDEVSVFPPVQGG